MRVRGRELCDVKVGEGQRQGALRGPRVRVQAPGPRLQRELRMRGPRVGSKGPGSRPQAPEGAQSERALGQGPRVQGPGPRLRAPGLLRAPGSRLRGSRVQGQR